VLSSKGAFNIAYRQTISITIYCILFIEGIDFQYVGAPGRIRTSDRLVRSQVLYPAELRARTHCGGEGGIRTLDEVASILP
jgi:hypothetical protein